MSSNFKDNNEFDNIIKKYIENDHVKCLENIPHHDSNRLNHCLKVSRTSYNICKKFNLNYKSAAKAGLLHDLYYNRISEMNLFSDKFKLFSNEHPKDAVENADKLFGLNDLEKNIILSHMWPISKYVPKYKESFIVSMVDKYYSFKEFGRKWNYQLTYSLGVYFILFVTFIFNS